MKTCVLAVPACVEPRSGSNGFCEQTTLPISSSLFWFRTDGHHDRVAMLVLLASLFQFFHFGQRCFGICIGFSAASFAAEKDGRTIQIQLDRSAH